MEIDTDLEIKYYKTLAFVIKNNPTITYGVTAYGKGGKSDRELLFGCPIRPMFRLKFKK